MSFHQQQWLQNIYVCMALAWGFTWKLSFWWGWYSQSWCFLVFIEKLWPFVIKRLSKWWPSAAKLTLNPRSCWNSLFGGPKAREGFRETLKCVTENCFNLPTPSSFSWVQETFLLWQSLPCFHQPSWGLKLTQKLMVLWKKRYLSAFLVVKTSPSLLQKEPHDSAIGLWNKSLKLKPSQNENFKLIYPPVN